MQSDDGKRDRKTFIFTSVYHACCSGPYQRRTLVQFYDFLRASDAYGPWIGYIGGHWGGIRVSQNETENSRLIFRVIYDLSFVYWRSFKTLRKRVFTKTKLQTRRVL